MPSARGQNFHPIYKNTEKKVRMRTFLVSQTVQSKDNLLSIKITVVQHLIVAPNMADAADPMSLNEKRPRSLDVLQSFIFSKRFFQAERTILFLISSSLA